MSGGLFQFRSYQFILPRRLSTLPVNKDSDNVDFATLLGFIIFISILSGEVVKIAI